MKFDKILRKKDPPVDSSENVLRRHNHNRNFSETSRLLFQKKSPALTTAQARQLAARAIQDEAASVPDLSAILHYRQSRNHAAYCSHRKRTALRQAKNHPKRKVS